VRSLLETLDRQTNVRSKQVRRSAILVHQLAYAPTGAHVAAVTTSLPERIGGAWNADYRLCWIRDTSLSLAVLTSLGHTEGAEKYMEWLGRQHSSTDAPLQVVYGIHGETELPQEQRTDLEGYRAAPSLSDWAIAPIARISTARSAS
jgi:GH15 family glucan-1,4-alpha-glucosidase